MSVGDLLRRRRAVAQHRHALAANDALFDAARDLRRRAEPYLNNGRDDLARPYLEEAAMFESATQSLPRM